MADRVRVFKRTALWHWWCPCCLDGGWHFYLSTAHSNAARHIATQH